MNKRKKIKYGIFTKPIHIEKLVNFLNQETDIEYIISVRKEEVNAFDFDIGVSYCFPHIIKINFPVTDGRIWYNYHPAPLPKYPGLNNYSFAIKDKIETFGITLHIMTDDVDCGPILKIKKFKLKTLPINTDELGCITHYHLFQLFKETIKLLQFKPKTEKELKELSRGT